jgi:hypothetical protein
MKTEAATMATNDKRPDGRAGAAVDRIVVVANEDDDGPLLDMAAQMAEALRAELHGLFIRNEALHDFAALPFAATSRPGAARSQPVNLDAIERAWTKGELRFRRALGRRATERRTTCSFMSRRGKYGVCLAEGVRSTDLIALSGDAPWMSGAEQLEAARQAAHSAFGVLIAGRLTRSVREYRAREHWAPIFAIDSGTSADAHAVSFAIALAQATGRPLVVLEIGTADLVQSPSLHGPGSVSIKVHQIPNPSATRIMQAINDIAPAFVVASLHGEIFTSPDTPDDLLGRLLAKLNAPIMLVGPGPGAN